MADLIDLLESSSEMLVVVCVNAEDGRLHTRGRKVQHTLRSSRLVSPQFRRFGLPGAGFVMAGPLTQPPVRLISSLRSSTSCLGLEMSATLYPSCVLNKRAQAAPVPCALPRPETTRILSQTGAVIL